MDQYVVIGHPVGHSLSPEIHLDFARQLDQEILYTKIDSPEERFEQTVFDFVKQGGCGASVTLPFKNRAFQIAKDKSQAAIDAMAANTLLVQADGTLLADNTDGVGLVQDLTHNHNYCLRQKRVCIIGAGGAVQGILGAILAQAPDRVIIANRTLEKAVRLAKHFVLKGDVSAIDLASFDDHPVDLLIHATPAGILGPLPDLPKTLVNEETWCYDLVYSQSEVTPFMRWAISQSAHKVLDGLGMLVEQAAAAFYLWRGVYPDTLPVIKDLRDSD